MVVMLGASFHYYGYYWLETGSVVAAFGVSLSEVVWELPYGKYTLCVCAHLSMSHDIQGHVTCPVM